jgi:HEAT repeat protein
MLRMVCWLALGLLCAAFEWPGHLPHLIYQAAHGVPNERSEAVRLLAHYPSEAVHDALLLAMEDEELEVRLEAASALGKVRAAEGVPLLMEWLDAKTPELRLTAVRALGEIADARAQAGLERALSDSVPGVRVAAVVALAHTPEAVPRLLTTLDDADSSVRRSVALALGELQEPSALSTLANHARDESADVRAAVLRALGRLHDARTLPVLIQALSDSDEAVHLAAISALGDVNSPAAVPPLRASLRMEPRLARTALAALGRIADPSAKQALIDSLEQPEIGPAAAFALLDSVRRDRNLNTAREPLQPVAALAKALASTTSAPHTTLLADVLSQLSDLVPITPAVPALAAALSEGRGDAQSLTRALALSRAPELLPPLLERMARAEAGELASILAALESYFAAGLGDGRATEPLLARLGNATGSVRIQLLHLIGLTHAARALPALAALLPNASSHEKLAIVEAIGQLPAAGARDVLWPVLDAAQPELRLTAARALAGSATPALVRELLVAIRDATAHDRQALVLAIGSSLAELARRSELDNGLRAEVLPVLASLTESSDDALSVRALDALRSLHDQRSMAEIARLLRAPSARRRSAAVFALGDFPHEDTRRLLRFVLAHDGPRVGVAAALALGEVGDQRDAAALARIAQRTLWPLPAAATYGLVRLAQRGVTKRHSMQRLLCELAASHDPYVRANIAAGLAVLAAPACDEKLQPLAWLGAEHSAALRQNSADWARALARPDGGVEPAIQQALFECAGSSDPQLARACRSRTAAVSPPRRLELAAYAGDAQSLLRERLVALRMSSGGVWVGYTDANGHLTLPAAVSGEVVLEDPANASPDTP